jgi:pimeloyl-ACP methyl ester carboxylesterase
MGPMPELAKYLSESYSVILYDRRGRNESSDTFPYAVEREIEDIAALIIKFGGTAYVFGTSSGAALALKAAAAGLSISKLALYEPPYMVDKNDHQVPLDYHEQLNKIVVEGRRGDAIKYFMKSGIGIPGFVVFLMQLMPVWSKLKKVAHTLPYDAAIMGDFSLPVKEAGAISVPTIVIGGEKSQSWIKTAVKKLVAVLPNTESQTLKGQTHNVSIKVLAPVLINFFKK